MINRLLVPSSVVFTPLKFLYGLHDVIFAETLAASDSFPLANDSLIRQTIFAPVDEAYADAVDINAEVLKQVRYNFIDSTIDLENVPDKALLNTKYELKALDGATQMVKVTKEHGKIWLNNEVEVLPDPGIPLKSLTQCALETQSYIILHPGYRHREFFVQPHLKDFPYYGRSIISFLPNLISEFYLMKSR